MSRCSAIIEIESDLAEEILKVISPENTSAPEDLKIYCYSIHKRLICDLSLQCSKEKGILRLRNTLDDLLQSIKLFLDTIHATDKNL